MHLHIQVGPIGLHSINKSHSVSVQCIKSVAAEPRGQGGQLTPQCYSWGSRLYL